MKNKLGLTLVFLPCLLCAALFGQAGPFAPKAALTLTVSPASPSIGSEVTVQVHVDLNGVTGSGGAVASLGGFCLPVAFDNTRLKLKAVDGGAAAEFGDLAFTDLPRANARGFVSLVNTSTTVGSPVGNVHVATLTFTVTAAGHGAFNVNSARTEHEGALASTRDLAGNGPALIAYDDRDSRLAIESGGASCHLVFPAFQSSEGDFMSFTLVNEGESAAALTFRGYDTGGNLLAASGLINPVSLPAPLGVNGQYFSMLPQAFGADAPLGIAQGWMDVESSAHDVSGFFILGHLEGGSTVCLDGTDVSHMTTGRLIFPVLSKDAARATKLTVVNPGEIQAEGTLKVMNADGTQHASVPVSIAPRGFWEASYGSGALAGDGYFDLALTGGAVTGLETFGGASSLATLAGSDADRLSNILYCPSIASGNVGGIRWYTDLNLINPGASTASVVLRLYNDNGTEVVPPVYRNLSPGQQLYVSASDLFGLPDPRSAEEGVQGYVKVESDQPLAGNIVFGDPVEGAFLSSLPFLSTSSAKRAMNFDFVATGRIGGVDYYTGLAAVNPSPDRPAQVTVTLYDASSAQVARKTVSIAPRGRFLSLVDQIDPAFNVEGQFGGFVSLSSDVEVYSFMMFGDRDFRFLAAVPVR